MKRKAICLFLCALLAASLFGCSGDVSVSFISTKPWENAGHEICTYEVKRIYTADGKETTVAEGTYTTELRTIGDETRVTNEFTLTYNDNAHANNTDLTGRTVINKGFTDGYTGTVEFKKDSLVPIKDATKAFTIAQRPLSDGEMGEKEEAPAEGIAHRYAMSGKDKYGDPQGYNYTIHYDTNKADYTTWVGKTVKEGDTYYRNYTEKNKSFTLGSGTRFDNEQLPYLVRSLSNMKKSGTATFYLTNMVDSYVKNKYVRHTMSMSCAKKKTSFKFEAPADYVLRNKERELDKTDAGEYTVPCINVTVGLSDAKSGPAIQMLITDPNVSFVQRANYVGHETESDKNLYATNRVILQMTYNEYALSEARVAYKTIYTLVGYTTV